MSFILWSKKTVLLLKEQHHSHIREKGGCNFFRWRVLNSHSKSYFLIILHWKKKLNQSNALIQHKTQLVSPSVEKGHLGYSGAFRTFIRKINCPKIHRKLLFKRGVHYLMIHIERNINQIKANCTMPLKRGGSGILKKMGQDEIMSRETWDLSKWRIFTNKTCLLYVRGLWTKQVHVELCKSTSQIFMRAVY